MSKPELFHLFFTTVCIFSAVLAALMLPSLLPLFKQRNLNKMRSFVKSQKTIRYIFISYICVIIYCTLVYKFSYVNINNTNILPFYTYKQAWNTFSEWSWKLIILNIVLFIPSGFIAPFVFKITNRWWATLLSGVLISLGIELAQLWLNIGYFDIDDIINNTLGTLIGYLFNQTVLSFKQKKKQAFLSAIPIFAIAGVFAVIFIAYYLQPYGNLSCNYVYKIDTSKINITSSINVKPEYKAAIYKDSSLSNYNDKSDIISLLSSFGIDINQSEIYEYPDQSFYTVRKPLYKFIKIFKNNMSYEYSTSENNFENMVNKYSEENIKDILLKNNITIPEGFKFYIEDMYTYVFEGCIIDNDILTNGILKCRISESDELAYLYNNINYCQKYADIDIINVAEGIERIKEGRFNLDYAQRIKSINIMDYDIEYKLDSKGYMQPVYTFNVVVNNNINCILSIPAIKNH